MKKVKKNEKVGIFFEVLICWEIVFISHYIFLLYLSPSTRAADFKRFQIGLFAFEVRHKFEAVPLE